MVVDILEIENLGRIEEWGIATDQDIHDIPLGASHPTGVHGLGAVFSDVDVDGDLDLYVANDTKPDRLYDNVAWPGGAAADPAGLGFRFEELAGRAGVADPGAGMGVAAADFDGDGRCDLFVTNARGQVHGAFRSRPANASGSTPASSRSPPRASARTPTGSSARSGSSRARSS